MNILFDLLDRIINELLATHPPEALKARIDDAAAKRADTVADIAEAAKFANKR